MVPGCLLRWSENKAKKNINTYISSDRKEKDNSDGRKLDSVTNNPYYNIGNVIVFTN